MEVTIALFGKLFADARALVQARRTPVLIAPSPSAAAGVDDVNAGEPIEQSPASPQTGCGVCRKRSEDGPLTT
jgi:hypothetical protein